MGAFEDTCGWVGTGDRGLEAPENFTPGPHIAHPVPLVLGAIGGVGTPAVKSPGCERGAADPPPPRASQRDRVGPACLHQRACCSPQCRVCCTTETFKHQGNMTFWKGKILIRHLSLIIPPLSEMHCNLSPKASVGTT